VVQGRTRPPATTNVRGSVLGAQTTACVVESLAHLESEGVGGTGYRVLSGHSLVPEKETETRRALVAARGREPETCKTAGGT